MSILEHRPQPTDEDRASSVWLPNKRNAEVRTYRGRSLEALLPKIRKDLGADAVILREREGLMGGVGGFFATRFVEVEARAGACIDVYDEGDDFTMADLPALPAAPVSEAVPALPAPAEPSEADASEFSAKLQEAVQAWTAEADDSVVAESVAAPGVPSLVLDGPAVDAPELEADPVPPAAPALASAAEPAPASAAPAPVPTAAPLPVPSRRTPAPARSTAKTRGKLPRKPAAPRPVDTAAAARIFDELVELGVSDDFARELLGTAASHGAAIIGGLRAAVRAELTRRLTAAAPLPLEGAAIAFVGTGGSGKSLASAALAATYRYGSSLPVSIASLCETSDQRRLADLLSPDGVPVTRVPESSARNAATVWRQIDAERQNGLVIIDTPGASPSDFDALADLSDRLDRLRPDAVYIVLSATLGAKPARRALTGLAPLSPNGIVISHADETDQVGVLIELAATEGLAVAYLTAGSDHRRSLIGTDPSALAQLLLP